MHLNLVYVSQLHPQICIRARPNDCCRWRRHGSLTASFYTGSACVCMRARACVCVRASDVRSKARKHHQPEPGFSHTIAFAFCSASCVYTVRCFATRPRPMIWKSGVFKLHETHPTTLVECTFTQVLYNFDLPPFLKKIQMYLTTLHYSYKIQL